VAEAIIGEGDLIELCIPIYSRGGRKMILDLHIHSKYSPDSISEPKNILKAAHKNGLSGVAITDHDTITGGVEAKKANKDKEFEVIVGCEVRTELGDVVGLFLNGDIKSRIFEEVLEEIHDQNGIVVLPHPYKGHTKIEESAREVDVIECFNSRTTIENNDMAVQLQEKIGVPGIAVSDAHFCSEVGLGRIITESHDSRRDILGGRFKIETHVGHAYLLSATDVIKSLKKKQFIQTPFFAKNFLFDYLRGK